MDYPKNLREFDRLFAHKDACLLFLEEVRWGARYKCQRCGSPKFWRLSTGLRRCQGCRFKNSVKTGTIFESSRLPLKMWFYAIWWITAQKTGVSALDLQKDVGLGSYRSAWLLLHKIRNAMTHADQALLQGEVELDEASVGSSGNEPVLIAVEFSGLKKIGRVRVERKKVGWDSFLSSNVEKTATLHRARRPRGKLQPHVQLVHDQLQRWLKGTLHGRLEPKHLDSYLEEFVFRFNRRTSKARGILFQRVIENAVRIEPAPYKKIVARKS